MNSKTFSLHHLSLHHLSLHKLGVVCGLAAGAWMGAAEVPVKLVNTAFSPFLISLGMVAGVFLARWTLPMVLKGTDYLMQDIRQKPHLIVWAILAGVLWAVANTLTIFAIRTVGLSIAFPLWNTNSLVGLLWGWLLFGELRNAAGRQWLKVLGGSLSIVIGTCLLAYASTQAAGSPHAATLGIAAALGAGLLWGAMYIPYRKAYISGMNPLSFVTIFTFGELGAVFALAVALDGGFAHLTRELDLARPALFWLFLGGFCWVVGDLFQQYAAKYIGIGRGIPLSNTNQLWGLAWGVLVFGETAGRGASVKILITAGSLLMVAGAAAISLAEARKPEQAAGQRAIERERLRYGIDSNVVNIATSRHNIWDFLIAAAALTGFLWLASMAQRPAVTLHLPWLLTLSVATLAALAAGGWLLWRRTRFS